MVMLKIVVGTRFFDVESGAKGSGRSKRVDWVAPLPVYRTHDAMLLAILE